MKTLCLSTDHRNQIRKYCADSYPLEACGLIIGWGNDGVTTIVPSPNLSDHPAKNFEIDPALIIRHQKESRLGHDRIIGHYHSHPDGQAVPSAEDQDKNHDPDLIWLIVQVTGGEALTMNAFATDSETDQLTAIPLKQEDPLQQAGKI